MPARRDRDRELREPDDAVRGDPAGDPGAGRGRGRGRGGNRSS